MFTTALEMQVAVLSVTLLCLRSVSATSEACMMEYTAASCPAGSEGTSMRETVELGCKKIATVGPSFASIDIYRKTECSSSGSSNSMSLSFYSNSACTTNIGMGDYQSVTLSGCMQLTSAQSSAMSAAGLTSSGANWLQASCSACPALPPTSPAPPTSSPVPPLSQVCLMDYSDSSCTNEVAVTNGRVSMDSTCQSVVGGLVPVYRRITCTGTSTVKMEFFSNSDCTNGISMGSYSTVQFSGCYQLSSAMVPLFSAAGFAASTEYHMQGTCGACPSPAPPPPSAPGAGYSCIRDYTDNDCQSEFELTGNSMQIELGCKNIAVGAPFLQLPMYRNVQCVGSTLSVTFHSSSDCNGNKLSMGNFQDMSMTGCTRPDMDASTVLTSMGASGASTYALQASCGSCSATPGRQPDSDSPMTTQDSMLYKITHAVSLEGISTLQFTQTAQAAVKVAIADGLTSYNVQPADVFILYVSEGRRTSLRVTYQVTIGRDQYTAQQAADMLSAHISSGAFLTKLQQQAPGLPVTNVVSHEFSVTATINGVTYVNDDSSSDTMVVVVVLVVVLVMLAVVVCCLLYYYSKAKAVVDKQEVAMAQAATVVAGVPVNADQQAYPGAAVVPDAPVAAIDRAWEEWPAGALPPQYNCNDVEDKDDDMDKGGTLALANSAYGGVQQGTADDDSVVVAVARAPPQPPSKPE